LELFHALAATWPPVETRCFGPWTLRSGGGGGNRVSAATLEGDLAGIDDAARAMRAMGQHPSFMLRPGEEALDTALAARGYRKHDPTVFMARAAPGLPPPGPGTVIFCDAPLACMIEIWSAGGIGPERLSVMDRASAPRTWLLARAGDRPAGTGFVAIWNGVAMMHAVHVTPESRRQGLAAQLIRATARWALQHDARTLALAVTRANTPARALYAAQGFQDTAGYHYRSATQL
jgi:GNAT superfamily N-acetyltransferase